MKKILMLAFCTFMLSSCYDDYIKDYEYSGVYFAYQTNVRTFVVGEGMNIKVGAALGGVMENTRNRTVDYKFENTLVTPDILAVMKSSASPYIKNSVADVDELLPMPSDYFTVSDTKMIIPKGEHVGTVTIRPDSAKFLSDPKTLSATYALPLYITAAGADSVVEPKRHTVIGLKYENMLFGNYWHGGVTVVKDASGKVIDENTYYTTIPSPETSVYVLKTVAPFELETNKIANGSGSMRLILNADGTVTIAKSPTSAVNVLPDGECRYNKAKLLQERKIFLKYKFENADGTTSHATDTLTFRNRIRDGVNEWQDENPGNYN